MKKAFTLIELLIVIALLGALAVGLLAALDPFEQLKKGTDTGTRNTVQEVQGSIIRYYALKGWMPWCNSSSISDCSNPTEADLSSLVDPEGNDALSKIIDTGELKTNFSELASGNLGKIFVTGTNESVHVCFKPVSKSFRCDPNSKYTKAGEVDPNCPKTACGSDAAADECLWCVE